MKECKNCNRVFGLRELRNPNVCPICKGPLTEKGATTPRTYMSTALKLSNYMDDASLFKLAVGKENGLLKADYPEEVEDIYRFLAFKGNSDAMYKLSQILINQQNFEPAEYWLVAAAKKGNEAAKLTLNYLFEKLGYEPVIPKEQTAQAPLQISSSDDFVDIVRDALPGIVSIISINQSGKDMIKQAGSGFIVEGGYVVTNAHVIGDNPISISASFDKSLTNVILNLRPLMIDSEMDLAVLKFVENINLDSVKQFAFANYAPQFGQKVYTIGNPLNLGLSVSQGIISSPRRNITVSKKLNCLIQTDISLNHGNSGGALLDMNNNVVGVCTLIPGETNGGIGLCIPYEYVVDAVNSVKFK